MIGVVNFGLGGRYQGEQRSSSSAFPHRAALRLSAHIKSVSHSSNFRSNAHALSAHQSSFQKFSFFIFHLSVRGRQDRFPPSIYAPALLTQLGFNSLINKGFSELFMRPDMRVAGLRIGHDTNQGGA